MSDDPAGLYARLGVDPAATPEAIVAAFRRQARVLHPDVVGTGNAEAFLRMKDAYDVLNDAHRRAAYDYAARAQPDVPRAASPIDEPVLRGPRLGDLPVALWLGLLGLTGLAFGMVIFHFSHPAPAPASTATAPIAAAQPPRERTQPPPLPAVLPATEAATHYVMPAAGVTMLWRHDPAGDGYLPTGQLPAFSPVRAVRLVPEHGLMEVRLADGGTGFVDAAHLTPGDGATAHRAYCIYDAGASPSNGEVFDRHGSGSASVSISNRLDQPLVVKLRDAAGVTAASVFIAPAGDATVTGLPDQPYGVEFATGQLWSRGCHGFAIGMLVQRLVGEAPPQTLSPLVIPPPLSAGVQVEELPGTAFEQN